MPGDKGIGGVVSEDQPKRRDIREPITQTAHDNAPVPETLLAGNWGRCKFATNQQRSDADSRSASDDWRQSVIGKRLAEAAFLLAFQRRHRQPQFAGIASEHPHHGLDRNRISRQRQHVTA